MRGTPLELEIDKATGRIEDEFLEFIEFVYEYIFLRIP